MTQDLSGISKPRTPLIVPKASQCSPQHVGLLQLSLPDGCTSEELQKLLLTQVTSVSGSIAYAPFLPLSVKMGYLSKEFADQRHRFLVGTS